MSNSWKVIAAAALVLHGVTAAPAAVLASAPLEGYPSAQTLTCNIVNLNTTPRSVKIEVLDYTGNVLAGETYTLLSNAAESLESTSGSAAWCRFTADGSARFYRAVAIYQDGDTYTVAIPAL